jgi:hypothetical protein
MKLNHGSIAILAFGFTVAAWGQQSAPPLTLYDQGGVSVTATETEDTQELAVSEPDPISVTVEVDRNQNGQIDRYVDQAYGVQHDGSLCAIYLIDERSTTACFGFASSAHLKDLTDDQGRRRYTLVVPKKELSFGQPSARLVLVIWDSAQKSRSFYPPEGFQQAIFVPYAIRQAGAGKVQPIRDDPGAQPEQKPEPHPDAVEKRVATKPEPPSAQAIKQYMPLLAGAPFWVRQMRIGVVRTDAVSKYHFVVIFTVPDAGVRSPQFPAHPFNLVTVSGSRVLGVQRVAVPNETLPSIIGDWKPGDAVRLEFDLPKEYADPSQGWGLTFCVGSTSRCLVSSNLLLDNADAPEPYVAGPHIRVENRSGVYFKNVVVNGKQYGDIKAGASTNYQTMEHAYKYASVTLTTDTGPMAMHPIDYIGERQLREGNYTYVLTIQDGRLIIECMVD